MEKIEKKIFDEERALYAIKEAEVIACSFDGPADGESALKESENISVEGSFFNLRYPLWHVTNGSVRNCEMTENCRAALWYDNNITIENCKLNGIKALRECTDVKLYGSSANSPEFMWRCSKIDIKDLTLVSEYPFFESRDISLDNFKLKGKYSFQYAENVEITDSELDTKDAFWHSKNVTVKDSVINGEYLGWYSENLRLIRCKIIGTQPLCYCKNLVLEDCTMINTDLSFERSEVNALVLGRIDGVKNPLRGKIIANEIGELLLEKDYIDPAATEIVCNEIGELINE